MSLPEKAFPVSWDQFHRDARALAWRLAGLNGSWKAIVCITRGGLVPAAIISRELGIRLIETVCVASYHEYVEQGELDVIKEVAPRLMENEGSDMLIIDDLTDTGKTAAVVRAMMPKAHFATIYAKPKGGRWSTLSSPRCRRIPGSISPGTWASPTRSRSPTAPAARHLSPGRKKAGRTWQAKSLLLFITYLNTR